MDGYRLTGADILGLIIFLSALVVRAVLQGLADPGDMPELGWITTFAGIAAVWLSLGARTRDLHEQGTQTKDLVEKTEHNTNGELTDKLKVLKDEIITEVRASLYSPPDDMDDKPQV